MSKLPAYPPPHPPAPLQPAGERGLDFVALARRRSEERGGQPWRSLEELAGAPEFAEMLRRDENAAVLEGAEGFDRRDLFKYLGVSFALSGITACTRQPTEAIN